MYPGHGYYHRQVDNTSKLTSIEPSEPRQDLQSLLLCLLARLIALHRSSCDPGSVGIGAPVSPHRAHHNRPPRDLSGGLLLIISNSRPFISTFAVDVLKPACLRSCQTIDAWN